MKYCVVNWPWILCSSLLNHSLSFFLTTGLFPWPHTPIQLPTCPPSIYRRIIYTSFSYSILLVLLPFSAMRIIVIFPQLFHWSALSSRLTGPLTALAHREALLIDTFSSLLAGSSLSASHSPPLVTLSFSDIFRDFSIILDTRYGGVLRDPSSLLYLHLSSLLPSWNHPVLWFYLFSSFYWLWDVHLWLGSWTPDFIFTYLYTMAKTKLSIPTPDSVLPKVLPSQVSFLLSGVQVSNLEPFLTLFFLSLLTSNPPANTFTQYF